MSFGDHLEELRKRVFLGLAAPVPLAIIALFFTDTLIEVLLLPLFRAQAANDLPEQVQALSPPEVVFVQLKLSILVALIASAPWIIWQAWLFISPGLYQHEKRFVNLLVPGSVILTISGVALLYYALLPIMLNVMIGIGTNVKVHGSERAIAPRVQQALDLHQPIVIRSEPPPAPAIGDKWLIWPDVSRAYIAVAQDTSGAATAPSVAVVPLPASPNATISQQFRLSEYIDFVLILGGGTVVGFQMPLVVMLLGWIGIASPEWFRRQRRYALFGCAAASAIITPSSDIISMLILMLPLYALYELGILLLVFAPAHKVAQGRVFTLPRWRWGRSDKRVAGAAKSAEAAQTDQPGRSRDAAEQTKDGDADSQEVRR